MTTTQLSSVPTTHGAPRTVSVNTYPDTTDNRCTLVCLQLKGLPQGALEKLGDVIAQTAEVQLSDVESIRTHEGMITMRVTNQGPWDRRLPKPLLDAINRHFDAELNVTYPANVDEARVALRNMSSADIRQVLEALEDEELPAVIKHLIERVSDERELWGITGVASTRGFRLHNANLSHE